MNKIKKSIATFFLDKSGGYIIFWTVWALIFCDSIFKSHYVGKASVLTSVLLTIKDIAGLAGIVVPIIIGFLILGVITHYVGEWSNKKLMDWKLGPAEKTEYEVVE